MRILTIKVLLLKTAILVLFATYANAGQAVPFRRIVPDLPAVITYSDPALHTIKTEEDFRKYIAAGYSYSYSGPLKDISAAEYKTFMEKQKNWADSLNIDFTKEMVIGLFIGDTKHYLPRVPEREKDIKIDRIIDNGSELQVYASSSPAKSSSALFTPYDLIVIPRHEIPVAFFIDEVRKGLSIEDSQARIRNYFNEKWHQGFHVAEITPYNLEEIRAAYADRQFYFVRSSGDSEDGKGGMMTVFLDANGLVNEVREAKDLIDGLMLVHSKEEAKIASAAIYSLLWIYWFPSSNQPVNIYASNMQCGKKGFTQ